MIWSKKKRKLRFLKSYQGKIKCIFKVKSAPLITTTKTNKIPETIDVEQLENDEKKDINNFNECGISSTVFVIFLI